MMMLRRKNGLTYNELPTIVMGIIFIVVMISVGALIVNRIAKEPILFTETAISNESFTPVAATAVQLGHDDVVVDSETLYNRSAGICKRTGNYSMNNYDGQITCLSGSLCCGGNSTNKLNITYSWRYYTAGYNATITGQESLLNLSEQLGLLVLVIAMAIIISAITMWLWKGF